MIALGDKIANHGYGIVAAVENGLSSIKINLPTKS